MRCQTQVCFMFNQDSLSSREPFMAYVVMVLIWHFQSNGGIRQVANGRLTLPKKVLRQQMLSEIRLP